MNNNDPSPLPDLRFDAADGKYRVSGLPEGTRIFDHEEEAKKAIGAFLLGSIKSAKKATASRANGKKGGRPRGNKT